VRFAFWGAEELGLFGSEHYVDSLTEAQLAKICANLNFDMVGSPNYVRFVYDGNGDSSDDAAAGPPGSDTIEEIFTKYFADRGLASEPTAFDGRSDYGPFIAAGIPAGGLFSGAEGIKTAQPRSTEAPLVWRTTSAITKRATPSATSTQRHSPSSAMRLPTPR
jgi:Zn-dependent M28 family amino/carboxypeptidase